MPCDDTYSGMNGNHFFAAVPYRLIDSLGDGDISPSMLAVMILLYRWADWKTGKVKHTSAKAIARFCGGKWSERTIQEDMRRLEKMGYIARDLTLGSHKWYGVTIHNYIAAVKHAVKGVDGRPEKDAEGRIITAVKMEPINIKKIDGWSEEEEDSLRGDCADASADTSYEASGEASAEAATIRTITNNNTNENSSNNTNEKTEPGPVGQAHGRAHSLALQFWELQGNPERHRKAIPVWEQEIGNLLTQEPELDALLTCLFSRELPYWSRAWDKGSPDPMAFLLRKLAVPVEEKGIRQTYDELVSRARAAKPRNAPPDPAAPPAGEPLWDINRMRSACTQVVNEVNTGKAYYEAHIDEFKTLHPDWVEELEWRIYGRLGDSGSAGSTRQADASRSEANGTGGRNAPADERGDGTQTNGAGNPA
jgi:hypothetical protein